MKTSNTQFVLMVTFMEQHGDLSKPSFNARGRISVLKHWEELTVLLNSDGTGDIKTTEKWKKVWSDYKNNTKKKVARLLKAANGTDGGPAIISKLTDLEQRTLNLMGMPVSTGLTVEEAGLFKDISIQSNVLSDQETQLSHQLLYDTQQAVSSPPQTLEDEKILIPEIRPTTSAALSPTHIRPVITPIPLNILIQKKEIDISPTRPSMEVAVQTESIMYGRLTAPRRMRQSRIRRSLRRRMVTGNIGQAAQSFLQAERFWRKFKQEQHKDYMEIEREQCRIRELEVQAQREWQSLGLRVVDAIHKIVDKFCKD